MLKSILLGLVAFVGASTAENVFIMTADNFDETVNNNEHVLVEFFAPWCGHCKRLAPEYEKAATALKEEGSAVILGSVDATEHKELGSRFGVRGYPTLKWFVDGDARDYGGGRDEATILSWVRKKTGPPATPLATADDVTAFADKSKVAVVAFFEKAEGAEYDAFVAHAKTDDDLMYGVCTDAAVAEANGAAFPSVVVFKKFDEGKNVLSEDLSQSNIASFVSASSTPIVMEFDMSIVQEVFNSKIGKVAYLFAKEDDKASRDAFRAVAEANRGKLVFVVGDESHDRVNNYVGVQESDFPRLVIMDTASEGNMKKYPLLDVEVNQDALTTHVDSFLAGSLKPHFKSDPIPEDNNGPVTVVVGKNFEDVVLDADKDVLLEIYAPWCGHCKKLAPAWEELGEAYADDANVVIAKLDGTTNEVEDLDASGFPTLKWFPAGEKAGAASGQAYNGGRTFEDLKQYVDDNRKSEAAAAPAAADSDDAHEDL